MANTATFTVTCIFRMTFGILRWLLGKVNGLTKDLLALAPWVRQQQIGLITFVTESPMELRQVHSLSLSL